ncbi:MAG: type III secretion system export apparatus subunit SctS [Burkholderiaceae bacterium]|jgi:type III secretion protein S|nr:EscS/YscS/HrcS family type III secretion system export apparatus protein [Betaproteobacteria bacterium]
MGAPEVVVALVRALYLTMLLSLPAIMVAAIVGTLFSLLQALTQIQEQTLSFAVKLIAVGVTLFLTAGWVGGELLNYTLSVFDSFPRLTR